MNLVSREKAIDVAIDEYNRGYKEGFEAGKASVSGGGDLISRQAAIDYFLTNVGWHDEDGYPVEDSDELRKIWTDLFNGVPSAQPERKKGKWINRSLNILYPEWERYTCSVCGKHSNNYDFCPNCGARIEDEK